jgi:hypothetical protein
VVNIETALLLLAMTLSGRLFFSYRLLRLFLGHRVERPGSTNDRLGRIKLW